MDVMKKVCDALNYNKELKYEQKVEILDLVTDFYVRFPNVSLENLCKNLKGLRIESGSKFQYPATVQYVPFGNKIVINKVRESNLENDKRHSMMRAVLAMITSNTIYYGFNNNPSLEALNEGFCDIMANNLVGNHGLSDYEDEQILVNFIGKSIGIENFQKAFFENDSELLMKELLSKCSSPEKLEGLLGQANNNMKTRMNSGQSRLFHIQAGAMQMFEYDKDYIMTSQTLQSSGVKYLDIEEIDNLVKTQARNWARGR